MILIIAGGRDTPCDFMTIELALEEAGWPVEGIHKVLSGRARGVDKVGEQWAESHGIPVKPMYANWKKYGDAAGAIRNHAMGDVATHLLAIWDGASEGTMDMFKYMRQKGKEYFVWTEPHLNIDRKGFPGPTYNLFG